MMIALNNNNTLEDDRESISNANSKDELTLITANNFTERSHSVIDDDVGPDDNLDYYPVKEYQIRNVLKTNITPEQIEIINVPERIKSYEDKSKIFKPEDSIDSYKYEKKPLANHEVDEYDLEQDYYGYNDSNRYCAELVNTVRYIPHPSVTVTRHELPHLDTDYKSSHVTNGHHPTTTCVSPLTTDIGHQITQLAHRIESLGNISRICQDDLESRPSNTIGNGYVPSGENNRPAPMQDQYSLTAARKLDEITRLQKKQEAMQNRLVELAHKLSDSTRDLSRPQNASTALDDNAAQNDEYMHAPSLKTHGKRLGKKSGVKQRKPGRSVSRTAQSSGFLNHILNEPICATGDLKPAELPLLSSSYCLHNDLSTGTGESGGISQSTSKYFNDELANIRSEFRTQVEEIRKLLSDRYQQSADVFRNVPQPNSYDPVPGRQVARDLSPSNLRNITNIVGTNNNCKSEESPLDRYLVKDRNLPELPSIHCENTPTMRPGILPSVAKAIKNKERMLSDPVEAERFLIELANRRENIENNLNCLERNKEGEFIFSVLEKLQGDESNVELARIQAMVDDAIASVTPEVNHAVKLEFQQWLERREHQRQQQLAEQQADIEFNRRLKMGRPVKHAVQPAPRYNELQSTAAVPGRPWVCKKYSAVKSKVDSGVRKPGMRARGSLSPPRQFVAPPDTHATWANRRRSRTPYLHFINDLKLAKKPVGPLGQGRDIPTITKYTEQSASKKLQLPKKHEDQEFFFIRKEQYSLDYRENKGETQQTQTSRQSTSKSSLPSSARPYQVVIERPDSPSLSEKGTGFQIGHQSRSMLREDRVGPFAPLDPTETPYRVVTNPINILPQKPQQPPPGPDINNLRLLIERALLDQIQMPSPTTSLDHSNSITRVDNISTPLPTERMEDYSSHFSPENSHKDQYDRTMSPMETMKTPEMSQAVSEFSFKPSRVSTPTNSFSPKASLKRPIPHEMVSEAMQTICDNAVQTNETKQVQTSYPNTSTQTPKEARQPRSLASASTTSEYNGSQTDTQVHSFSDGMWLYDRSEGEMAPYQIDNVPRWRLGACPDNPIWFNGTDNLTHIDRHSSLSFGEFNKPTLPGLVPTQDAVLQLNTLPFRQRFSEIDDDNGYHPDGEDEFVYLGHRRNQPDSPNFQSLGVSRESKSRFTTPRNYPMSPTRFEADSEGEVEYEERDVNSNSHSGDEDEEYRQPVNNQYSDNRHLSSSPPQPQMIRSIESAPGRPSMPERRQKSPPYQMNLQQSGDSAVDQTTPVMQDSQSDRIHIDVNKYLRASRQSQSDMSDGAGLMSTGQIVANAFRCGDSADLEGSSDFGGIDRPYEGHFSGKQAVKIPTLGTVEHSNPSVSDDNLEIIDI